MLKSGKILQIRKMFTVPADVEKDSDFNNVLSRLHQNSMLVGGLLGIILPLAFVLINLIFGGKSLAWQYGEIDPLSRVVLLDKLLIILLGVVCLMLSRIKLNLKLSRIFMALFLTSAGFAMIYDDIFSGDISFSPAYLTLLLIISLAVRFRAWQTFVLGLLFSAIFVISVVFLMPAALGEPQPFSNHLTFLFLVTLACSAISALLYRGQYRLYLEKRRAEKLTDMVADSEKKYRSLFDNASDAIFVIDNRTGCFTLVNPTMENLLGIPADKLYLMKFSEIIHPDDLQRVIGYHTDRLKGKTAPLQYRLKISSRISDEPRICDLKLHSFEKETGITVGSVRDVTDEIKAAEKIRKYADELEETNRVLRDTQAQLVQSAKLASLGNLAAGIAHKVNTPLGAINSNAQVSSRAVNIIQDVLNDKDKLSSEEFSGKIDKALTTIDKLNNVTKDAVGQVDAIVTALRNFANLDEADYKKIDIHDNLDSTLTILTQSPEKKIDIIKDYGEVNKLCCYPNQLNQVFMNLLLNAVDAIEAEGKITISTTQENDLAIIRITDTGQGIPEENLEHIFDPGFTTRGVSVGAGLGLSTCYRNMENHNGRIEISSELGKGTTVTLHLPVR